MIDSHVLTQSLSIIEYLDETRPAPALLPEDAAARAHVLALALAIACEIHPVPNLGTLARVEALAGPEARATWNRETIATGLEAFEALLDHPGFTGAFCLGSSPGIADCTLIPYPPALQRHALGGFRPSAPEFQAAIPGRFAPGPAAKDTGPQRAGQSSIAGGR